MVILLACTNGKRRDRTLLKRHVQLDSNRHQNSPRNTDLDDIVLPGAKAGSSIAKVVSQDQSSRPAGDDTIISAIHVADAS